MEVYHPVKDTYMVKSYAEPICNVLTGEIKLSLKQTTVLSIMKHNLYRKLRSLS